MVGDRVAPLLLYGSAVVISGTVTDDPFVETKTI